LTHPAAGATTNGRGLPGAAIAESPPRAGSRRRPVLRSCAGQRRRPVPRSRDGSRRRPVLRSRAGSRQRPVLR